MSQILKKMSIKSTYSESLLSEYRNIEEEILNVHVISEHQYQRVQQRIISLENDNEYFQ